MCDFCIKHGEGKKWYLNVRNYSEKLFKNNKDAQEFLEYLTGVKPMSMFPVQETYNVDEWMSAWKELDANLRRLHWGQIVPLEDAKAVLNLANPICKFVCVCRKGRGKEMDTCLGFGLVGEYGKKWPDYSKLGFEYISREEAKELVERCDVEGLVHQVYTAGTPYIAFMCQCTFPDCLALQYQLWYGTSGYNAEYVVMIDPKRCNGCKECRKKCQFGAIGYTDVFGVCLIDIMKCRGCGLCRQACENRAIKLVERAQIPGARDLWYPWMGIRAPPNAYVYQVFRPVLSRF